MAIKYFEVIGEVIDALINGLAEHKGLAREELYARVVELLKENSKQWRSGKQPVIAYDNPLCRVAYLYNIVAANAALINHSLWLADDLEEYIDSLLEEKDELAVCAFGGGPGTELLGIARWLEQKRKTYKRTIYLDLLLLDRVREWGETWRAMKQRIQDRFRAEYGRDRAAWPVAITDSFQTIDITDTAAFANVGTLFHQDLYILSYVVSEVIDHLDDLGDFTAEMAKHAPVGARFLFIERDEERWRKLIPKLAEAAGLTVGKVRPTAGNVGAGEDKESLGAIHKDVNRNPRLGWNAFWVVATKEPPGASPKD